MREITHTIQDQDGIHARPAGMLVKKLQEFKSEVTVKNGDKTASGKKLFQIMKLGAKCGDTITVAAEGEDEDLAIAAAQTLLTENL